MIRTKLGLLTIFSLVLTLVGCGGGQETPTAEQQQQPAAAPAAAPVDPATAGSVTGKVAFEGQAPAKMRIRMDATPACAEKHQEPVFADEVIVNSNGTLSNVFIYVKDGLGNRTFPMSSQEVVLDQDGCIYHPHVLGLMVGQKLRIKNSDPTNHNIHPMPANNREFNVSQPPGGEDMIRDFPREEVMIPVKCNVHPWMKAYVGVVSHPFFAVTGSDGSFELKGLPPGDYTIEAWHEKYGASEQKVTIAPQETKTVDFNFKG
ncbi:MAG: carboxypeptidase regulatory-like domain-containing protein [Acidobacteria bacterium]|nr:carboxypeptidase regulatory-like domain-containing protein [Acidobacteriota bacterium]